MALEPMRFEVRRLLADVDLKIREAEHALWMGLARERVDAAGELAFLKGQKESLQARLAELESFDGSTIETVVQWFKEEGMLLHRRLEEWMVHA